MFTSQEWAGFAAACRSPVLVPTQASQQAIVSAADDDPMYTLSQWEEIREMFAADDAAPSPLHSQHSAAGSAFTASQWADFLTHWETPLNSQPAEDQQEAAPSPLHSQRSAAESAFSASQWADFLSHWETPMNSQPAEEQQQQEAVHPSQQQQQHLSQQQHPPEVLTYPVVIAYTSSIHSSI